MKKLKEINIIGKTNYKKFFDDSIVCGELSNSGCGKHNWNIKEKKGIRFKLECNECNQEVEVEIPSHHKYIKDASEEKKTF